MTWNLEDALAQLDTPDAVAEERAVEAAGVALAAVLRAEPKPGRDHGATLKLIFALARRGSVDYSQMKVAEGWRAAEARSITQPLIDHALVSMRTEVRPSRTVVLRTTLRFEPAVHLALDISHVLVRACRIEPSLEALPMLDDLLPEPDRPARRWWASPSPVDHDTASTWLQRHVRLIPWMVDQATRDYAQGHALHLGLYLLLLCRGPLTDDETLRHVKPKKAWNRARNALNALKRQGLVVRGPNPGYRTPMDHRSALGIERGYETLLPYVVSRVDGKVKRKAAAVARVRSIVKVAEGIRKT